jgi:hypothetical protein
MPPPRAVMLGAIDSILTIPRAMDLVPGSYHPQMSQINAAGIK